MSETEHTTREQILAAAKAEFLQKGFKTASLRNIVKTAGVTTGAFYGYYGSKAELFDALVAEQYDTFMGKFRKTQEAFTHLSPEAQKAGLGVQSSACMVWMTEYAYDHFDIFKLLLCCSEGTKYENMIHEMVQMEIEATHSFAKVMEKLGFPSYNIDPQLEHILVSGLFTAFFEMIVHDIPREKAMEYLHDLREFYMAGWKRIMGL